MNKTQPIKDIKTIKKIKDYLLKTNERDYIIFLIGINTGLRISDILNLKVSHVKNEEFKIRESKSNELITINISNIHDEVKNYIRNKPDCQYLFKSRKGKNKPISRVQAFDIFKKMKRTLKLNETIGTHFMRKTFAYHYLRYSNDFNSVQNKLHHMRSTSTMYYLNNNNNSCNFKL